jgi:hypothetical protein
MASVTQSGRVTPESNIDLEKEQTHTEDPEIEAIHTHATHALGRSDTTKSTHPLELTESHRTYSGFKWFLVCIAMYIVSCSIILR